MKRLELSRLMDEYQNNEFFPEGGGAADAQAVKDRVLANVKPAEPKKQTPRKKKVLIAAALAAVMVVLVGAGFPSIVYRLATGLVSFDRTEDGKSVTYSHDAYPVEMEDGQLWFVLGGQRIDITDVVREDTPYIYDNSDSSAGIIHYLVVGGSPESCRCLEWVVVPDPQSGGTTSSYAFGSIVYSERWNRAHCESSCLGFDTVTIENNRIGNTEVPAWLVSAMDELGIPYEYISSEDITVIHN